MKNKIFKTAPISVTGLFSVVIAAAFLLAQSPVFSQDLIFYKNGDDQMAKVLEISTTEVKFKKWDNLDGPTHAIPKADVWMIKYQNGTKELVYKQVAAVQKTTPAAAPVAAVEETEPAPALRRSAPPAPEKPRKPTHIFIDDDGEKAAKKRPEVDRNGVNLFVGASIPTGSFGEENGEGHAKPGFIIGIEEVARFGSGMVRPVFHASFSKHPVGGSLETNIGGEYYDLDASGNYRTLCAMSGLRLEGGSGATKFYAAAMGGYCWSALKLTLSAFGESVTQEVGAGPMFNYSLGAGALVNEKIDIGLRMNSATAYFSGDFDARQPLGRVDVTVGYHF